MNSCIRVLVGVCLLCMAGCALPQSNTFVHPRTWPHWRDIKESPAPRQLVIFMDGTANTLNDRTNVRRLYELTTAAHRPDVLTFYDPGVGTGDNKLYAGLGAVFGLGFQRNIEDALTFLVMNYREGDQISIFGFSRGGYCAGVLASVIAHAGFPSLSQEDSIESPKFELTVGERRKAAHKAVKKFYNEVQQAERYAKLMADRAAYFQAVTTPKVNEYAISPHMNAAYWRSSYWAHLRTQEPFSNAQVEAAGPSAKRHLPKIDVVALWEPVDSLISGLRPLAKVGFSTSQESEFARHRGHRLHPYAFNERIENCYFALALDEQRQAFLLELPDYLQGKPRHSEFVWFAGDHSDLGGGHRNKDLAGISLNWILEKVAGRLFGPEGKDIRVYEDHAAPRHDLYSGTFYRHSRYRVRGEVFGDVHQDFSRTQHASSDPFPALRLPRQEKWWMPSRPEFVVPVRASGWTMRIHESVLARMESTSDLFTDPNNDAVIHDLARCKGLKHSEVLARNPGGRYVPRPFRSDAALEGAKGWVATSWSAKQIRDRIEHAEWEKKPNAGIGEIVAANSPRITCSCAAPAAASSVAIHSN